MRLPTARSRAATVLALVVAGSVVLTAAPASAAPNTERLGDKLAREVTVGGVNRHLIALQRIADQNGGTRASGTPGFDASATYVHDKLAAAGWNVTDQEFEFPFFQELAPPELDRISPDPKVFVPGEEVVTYQFSAAGEVTGVVQPDHPGDT
jgi:hypothetical protein